jgi:hypothetical protein
MPGRALFAGVYMTAIFVLSSLSATEVARLGLPSGLLDLGHVPLFAGLAAVTLWALVGSRWHCAAAAMVLCAIFAITDEWHQAWVPGRVPALEDLIADGAGILIGVALVTALPDGWRGAVASEASEAREGGVEE